ncbi:S-adenosyl-L-methionine-dependent methyltransferase [Dentipellis sp. KUC8613]|nr:S-adenosyl-L-methionine-dependent methyltransferase [Dentipellis sp. KUC8613]
MGFWEGTTSFPQACEALALHLVRAAGIKPGSCVLDVGHGSGDSLLMQLSHPLVPRPKLLYGITSLKTHHIRSEERVGALLASKPDLAQDVEVTLSCGDAVCGLGDNHHPLSSDASYRFDTILALDCAYHFRTRECFLRQCFQRLAPGGKLALADICFASVPGAATLFVLTSILHVLPKENAVTIERYIQDMRHIGFVDVKMEDITNQVFPGFQDFLRGQGLMWRFFAGMIGWLHKSKGRFVIVVGTKPKAM